MIELNEYVRTNNISRKEYLKKYDSNVGYALYVQDNIRNIFLVNIIIITKKT